MSTNDAPRGCAVPGGKAVSKYDIIKREDICLEKELIVFLAMLGVFLLGNFLLKLPVSLSMVAGALAGRGRVEG